MRGDCPTAANAESVLLNPLVDAAVLEISGQSVAREGLGFDACTTALVLGDDDAANRALLHALAPESTLVLHAAAASAVDLADRFDGPCIVFSQDAKHALIERHRGRGGRVVLLQGRSIGLVEHGKTHPPIGLD